MAGFGYGLAVDLYFDDFLNEIFRGDGPRRYIRDFQNPFEYYDDTQFLKRYRFCKDAVIHQLVPLLFPPGEIPNQRGQPIPNELKVLTALRYYATGNFQVVSGDLLQISQPSVCRIVAEVSALLARKVRQFVKFPTDRAEFRRDRARFYQQARFPGVLGIVDGTHVPIVNPGGLNGETFRNRKSYFSINVQVICGPRMEFLNIVVRWPGSAHDSRVFDASSVRVQLENRAFPGWLIGDSAYAQRTYIFIPHPEPTTRAEHRYNRALRSTRNLVERAIGVWKRKFPCLKRVLTMKLERNLKVITACAVLHNIRLAHNYGDEDEGEDDDDPNDQPEQDIVPDNVRGRIIREAFIQRHFR